MKALPAPSSIPRGKRTKVHWAGQDLPAHNADEGFYRICGVKGSGKSHLTKLFILDALREVEWNPHGKLIVYEPKREFYAWLCSLGLKSKIDYFLPSDRRSVALDFTRDYESDQDSMTLAQAFWPIDPHEHQRFWGDSLRTIYASVHMAIKAKIGRADLRLMCLVLENEEYTRTLLGYDPYLVQAAKLIEDTGEQLGPTTRNIIMTVHSRIAEMKVIAAQMDEAQRENGLFSLLDFVKQPEDDDFDRPPEGRVLVVSKDSRFRTTQDPMNGILFLRLVELLDSEQADPRRKVFVVIDEFPTLAGDKPCPGITDMFLRLRSRGVTVLVTYQAHTTLLRVYGKEATEHIGQCTNVIYLRQADVDSANYAESDLGFFEGYEKVVTPSVSGSDGRTSWSVQQSEQWVKRPLYPFTELLNKMQPATKETGVEVRAKSPGYGPDPWSFTYPPQFIDRAIPRRNPAIEEYIRRDKASQRLLRLDDDEMKALGLEGIQAKPKLQPKPKRKPNYPPTD
jgi:Type IV secretion-system coupling protein DNA-binding domain